jgi:flagellar motor switch protein FliG
MKLELPWPGKKAAVLILSLEGEVANLLFMLLKDDVINVINENMDNVGSPSEQEKGEVILGFHSLLKARVMKPDKGKAYAKGYLQKTFDKVEFIDKLFDDYPLADISASTVKTEMDIVTETVVNSLKKKSFFSSIDSLRAELVELIVKYPVDAAMILTFLIKESN